MGKNLVVSFIVLLCVLGLSDSRIRGQDSVDDNSREMRLEGILKRLINDDRKSTKHHLPSFSFLYFLVENVLNLEQDNWIIKTVHKDDGFDYICLEGSNIRVYQLPELLVLEVSGVENNDSQDPSKRVLNTLKKYFKGKWVQESFGDIRERGDYVTVSSKMKFGYYSDAFNTFMALVYKNRICIAVPSRLGSNTGVVFGFTPKTNLNLLLKRSRRILRGPSSKSVGNVDLHDKSVQPESEE